MTPEEQENPYPYYHQMRVVDPIYWHMQRRRWILTRYDDIITVLRDPRFSSARMSAQFPIISQDLAPLIKRNTKKMLVTDPPDHTRLRKLVSSAFSPRILERMRENIQRIANDLIDVVQDIGHMDVIQDFAAPLPLLVITSMLDLPLQDLAQFKRWCDDMTNFFIGANIAFADAALQSMNDMDSYLRPIIAKRRIQPGNDILSILVNAAEQGDILSEEELLANIVLIINAGHETTRNLVGNGLLALLRYPERLRQLQKDPTLIPTALEELLRYDSPVQRIGRVATDDVRIGERTIKKGQLVVCVLGAANRDPAQFSEPDRLNIGRQNNRHLAFGLGSHYCLGASLARIEGQIAFETLLYRLPKLELATDNLTWHDETNSFRGLRSLPVNF